MKICNKCAKEQTLDSFRERNNKHINTCKNCERIACKKWREKNKDRVKENNREYRKKNKNELNSKDRIKYLIRGNSKEYLKRRREYYKKNKEKLCKYSSEWVKKNPKKHAAKERLRRNNKRTNGGKLTKESIAARFDYYGNKCYYCDCCEGLTIEHRIPICRGGTNYPSNIVPACRSCNSKKGKKTEKEFKKLLDKLK